MDSENESGFSDFFNDVVPHAKNRFRFSFNRFEFLVKIRGKLFRVLRKQFVQSVKVESKSFSAPGIVGSEQARRNEGIRFFLRRGTERLSPVEGPFALEHPVQRKTAVFLRCAEPSQLLRVARIVGNALIRDDEYGVQEETVVHVRPEEDERAGREVPHRAVFGLLAATVFERRAERARIGVLRARSFHERRLDCVDPVGGETDPLRRGKDVREGACFPFRPECEPSELQSFVGIDVVAFVRNESARVTAAAGAVSSHPGNRDRILPVLVPDLELPAGMDELDDGQCIGWFCHFWHGVFFLRPRIGREASGDERRPLRWFSLEALDGPWEGIRREVRLRAPRNQPSSRNCPDF